MIKVEVKIKYSHLKIYIDGILHLSVKVEEIVGIQSYLTGKERYHIDITTKTSCIECMYTRKDIWTSILKQIDKFGIV